MGGIVRAVFGGSKTSYVRAQQIGSFTITEAAYGKPVPIVFGTARLSGNMVDFVDFKSHEHRTRTGGKGGRGGTVQIDYTYTVAASLAICEGPIAGINRVFMNKDIVEPDKFSEQNYIVARYGSRDQEPWDYMVSTHPERALSYSNLAMLHGRWDLGSDGMFPALSFEVKGMHATVNGDAKPYKVLDEILTNENWGCGWTKDMLGDSQAYRDYCDAYDLSISVCLTDQKSVANIIDDIMKATNSTQRWSQGKLYFVPLEHRAKGKYKPNVKALYHITESDIVEGSSVVIQRKPLEKKYNQRIVEFLNRDNFYEKEAVYAENLTDIQIHGLKSAQVVSLPYITGKKQAQYIAQQMLQRDQYVRNQYKFKLGVKHSLLEPGDIVYLSCDELMLEKIPIMILSKVEGANAEYDIVAEDVMFHVEGGEVFETENANPYIVDRVTVPNDSSVLVFEPSLDLSDATGKLEVWVASCGSDNWGGASIWVSYDNEHFERVGFMENASLMGKVIGNGNGSVTVEIEVGQIMDGQKTVYLDGDFVPVDRFELVGERQYKLHGVNKQYPIGSPFAMLENLFTIPYTAQNIGEYMYVKVVAMNAFGNAEQDMARVKTHAIYLKGHTPPDVGPILVEQMERVKRIVWDYEHSGRPYIAGYRIKCNAGSNTWWDDGYDLAEGLITNSPFDTSQLDGGGAYTIMIKAVSKAGVESRNASRALINLGDVVVDNVLWEDDILTHKDIEATNIINDGGIWYAKDTGGMFYPSDRQPMYPDDNKMFYRDSWADVTFTSTFTPDTKGMMTIDSDIQGNYRITYRERYPYRFYPNDYQKMFPKDDAKLFNEGPWVPYNGKVENSKASLYDIRVDIRGGENQGCIKALKVVVDVPDLTEVYNDVRISADGTRLKLKNNFIKIKAINGTIQGSDAVTLQVVDKDVKKGPLVKLLNASGKAVEGLLDVTIQGY